MLFGMVERGMGGAVIGGKGKLRSNTNTSVEVGRVNQRALEEGRLSVAIVALGCFHPVTKVQSASLHFFVGNDEGSKDSDDESDDDVGSCLQKRYPIAQTIIITSQSSKTFCIHPHPVERSQQRSGTYRRPRHLRGSRRAPPTSSFSYLSSAPYILPNGPAPSQTSHRYSNLADWCSCATMADTTSRSCASKAVGYSTKTSKSAVNAARVYFFELDELALLFTGSHAPPTAHLQLQRQVASTEVDDENGDGEDEGGCGAKDERLPDGLASPPIPPSLDFSSSTTHSPSPDPSKHLLVNRKQQLTEPALAVHEKPRCTASGCRVNSSARKRMARPSSWRATQVPISPLHAAQCERDSL
ncbi:hypothetical protein DFH94DRAFT_683926 [Russula ochroleuca]|uniref:Uncharacterized protein n=1 Tax=Russula ochroleuca TaxID=152965 RepID=A0A9P5MRE8_9AGAM|nr:hypothetical protein DFH94DRAFT_683926 [Russula ochroleuca]